MRQTELHTVKNVIMWGTRVVIPDTARGSILTELHSCHFGMVKMKALARTAVWWPGIDRDVETLAARCYMCRVHSPSPPKEELHPWQYPPRSWSRLHIDFAGPKNGKYFLVLVDAHSKWIEVAMMNSMEAKSTVKTLTGMFARFGLPDVIVSDNAPTFTSSEFQQFLTRNRIDHRTIAPYCPQSNGLAERAVRELKVRLDKLSDVSYLSMQEVIDKWLFLYRVTPHATTGETPGQLLLGYKPITRLDKLKPDIEGRDCTGAGGDCTGAGDGCGSADGGPRSDAGAASAAAESCCCRRRRRVLAISANEPPVCRTVCGRGVRVFR
ncbi:uncharacterized protein K02A2.6-like [Amphibalanus amphitrite]|uniref:uncharacterized protein K02A2.6-like n=1 Tax=Amphibalanus amphitrite TaxID=1232801 RepID=UPI001C92A99C|nr:uncharacterized protein K02A2.6-like [Amphibalanus amphitrite]